MFGHKIGYAPINSWVGEGNIQARANCDYTLIVDSKEAIVISVKQYDFNRWFPKDVKRNIINGSLISLEFIKQTLEKARDSIVLQNMHLEDEEQSKAIFLTK